MCEFKRILEILRFYSFWSIDFLRGSKIKKQVKDIDYHITFYNTKEARAKRESNLNTLLNHAIKTTPFYKDYSHFKAVTDFPIIDKNTIRKTPEHFKSNTFKNKKTKKISTSGSTGAVLTIEQNKGKLNRNTADAIYFYKKIGFKIGYNLLFLKHWNSYFKKGKLQTWVQNITPIEVFDFSEDKVTELLKTLKGDCSTKGWLGYASGFELLCQFLDKKKSTPLHINVKSIVAISEHLNDYTRARMSYYFNAPIVSRYSNMENGIIAQQDSNDSSNFEINWASYFIEVLDFENDTPVNPGEPGRIVITDLFNYCTPLIRYNTGDVGIIDAASSPPAFKTIEGRKSDIIFNTKGDIVSSFIMLNINKFDGVKQSQLIQTDSKTYILKLNIVSTFTAQNHILEEFKGYLGHDANITIQLVDEIPILGSGKRRVTVNKMKANQTM